MAYFAVGPLANNRITVQQVVRAGLESDLPTVPTGSQRIDVTTLIGDDNPNTYRGRLLDVSDSANPSFVAVSDTTLADRRRLLKDNLLAQEAAFRGVWADRDFYELWLAANCRAGSVDANLLDATRWGQLLSESQIDGTTWYILAGRAVWRGYYTDFSVWWQTADTTGANPGTVGGLQRRDMEMNQAANFSYVQWLRT